MEIQPESFLTLSPLRDNAGRSILLLHTHKLPSQDASPSTITALLRPTVSMLPPTGPLTLILCHGGHGEIPTTRAGVRAVRTAFENNQIVSSQLRDRIQKIVGLHISFMTRAQIYMASFGMAGDEYSKLHYCDLLADLERFLGIDSTLLGLQKVDFDYDEQMRHWVGRQEEHQPVKSPDPSTSLIDMSNVSFDLSDTPFPAETENHTDAPIAQP